MRHRTDLVITIGLIAGICVFAWMVARAIVGFDHAHELHRETCGCAEICRNRAMLCGLPECVREHGGSK